jgi:membrane protein implicated in regulation of membrane protease activity
MNELMPYIWIGIIVFASVVEIHTFAFVPVWFLPPALASFTLSLVGIPVRIQVIIFFSATFMLLLLSRTLFRKSKRNRASRGHDHIIGRHAIVTEEINNYKDTGAVRINGLTWTAKSDDDDIIYESGLVVTVIDINDTEAICSR